MSSLAHSPVNEFTELPSTQDEAKRRIQASESPLSFIVRADHQTQGRGRSARSWSSLPGNLQATFVLPVQFDLAIAANFSFLTAVAVSATLDRYIEKGAAKIEHKWPNDIWVNDRKLCGILLEIYKKHLLIGVGANLKSAPDGAISLLELTGKDVSPNAFMQEFVVQLDQLQSVMFREGFDPIREKWLERARGVGQAITVRMLKETFHGVFDGIEPNGALRVLIEGQREPRIVYAGDVFFGSEKGGPDAARH